MTVRDVRYEPLATGLERRGSEAPVRVCIATPEVVGPYKCGGIGTLYTTLGESLAAAGHDVTLLYLRGSYSENGPIEDWVEHYRDKGISFVPLPPADEEPARGPRAAVTAHDTHAWLKSREFDVVHFPELGGPGRYAMLAKRQGAGFQKTLFVVGTHGPTLWVREANAEPLRDLYDLENDYAERESVALADVVWSPSRYLFGWMEDNGFTLSRTRYVQPYILPQAARARANGEEDAARDVRELVFFGRLESRKGIELFCDALDELHEMGHSSLEVSFLGRNWNVGTEDSHTYIQRRAVSWPWTPRIVSDLNQPDAIAFLAGEGRLAVMPSFMDNSPNTVYECLGRGIPFLASDSGGIPELVHEDDAHDTCFPLEAAELAKRLDDALRNGQRVARRSISFEENEVQWIAWHEQAAGRPRAVDGERRDERRWPLVSLCVATPGETLDEGVREKLRALDYPALELLPARADSTEDLGPAWSEAWRRARGDYLLFLDERHRPRPDAVAALVGVAETRGAELVTSFKDHVLANDDGGERRLATEVVLGASLSVAGFENPFGDGPLLVKSEVLDAIQGFEPGVRGTEDFLASLCLKAVLAGYRYELVPDSLFSRLTVESGSDEDALGDPYSDHAPSMNVLGRALPPALRNLALAGPSIRYRRERDAGGREGSVSKESESRPAERLLRAAQLLVDESRHDVADSLLSHARRLAGANGRPAESVHVDLVTAYAQARAGDGDAARSSAAEAIATADKSGNALLRFEACLRGAEIASLARDVDTSKRLYLDAFKLARRLNKPQMMIEALTSAGTAHAALREVELARQMWTTASRLAEQNRFPRALARTRELLASLSMAG